MRKRSAILLAVLVAAKYTHVNDFAVVLAATSIAAVMVWLAPAASVTAWTLTLPVSTHTICGHSSSPKSGMAWALSTHGFQTTVALERLLRTTIRRRAPGS